MRRLLLILTTMAISLHTVAQISVGLRNNRFVNVALLYKDSYSIKLEQSIFSENLGLQYMRGYVSYQTTISSVALKGAAYFGATFNRLYYSTGVSVDVRFRPKDRLFIDGRLNPHYDSGYGYTTCYYSGLGVGLNDHIDLFAAYTNTPEFRMPEKRLNIGVDFHVKNLKVLPRLSLNISPDSGPKSLRPIIDFEYTFQSKANHE